ncbi:uncharacterized protein LOC110346061 [Heterocephalus glaber]|uniref:Uncharacterized protein LOC110346061 n=1 Tax=Heterocephalus glaber TaxID=10181 RepID=A0AAX6RZ72_HETGA|nr:uncharacterized protein LOC110346061 [Heterocephalus glaber]
MRRAGGRFAGRKRGRGVGVRAPPPPALQPRSAPERPHHGLLSWRCPRPPLRAGGGGRCSGAVCSQRKIDSGCHGNACAETQAGRGCGGDTCIRKAGAGAPTPVRGSWVPGAATPGWDGTCGGRGGGGAAEGSVHPRGPGMLPRASPPGGDAGRGLWSPESRISETAEFWSARSSSALVPGLRAHSTSCALAEHHRPATPHPSRSPAAAFISSTRPHCLAPRPWKRPQHCWLGASGSLLHPSWSWTPPLLLLCKL